MHLERSTTPAASYIKPFRIMPGPLSFAVFPSLQLVHNHDTNCKEFEPIKPQPSSDDEYDVDNYNKAPITSNRWLGVRDGRMTFLFGMHCDRPLIEVAREEPSYLHWMLKKQVKHPTLQRLSVSMMQLCYWQYSCYGWATICPFPHDSVKVAGLVPGGVSVP